MDCPNCHSADRHHVIRGPRNALAVLVNFLNTYVLLSFWPFISFKRIFKPARPLQRRCLNCGYTFRGQQPELPD